MLGDERFGSEGEMRYRRIGCTARHIAMIALFSAALSTAARSGGTPYEAQIGGFIYASLQTFILGEFAGRRTTNTIGDAQRRACQPEDFRRLADSAKDEGAVATLEKSCHVVHFQVDDNGVNGTAYLPGGTCEALKAAYDQMLTDKVHANPAANLVEFEYKNSRYLGSRGHLARAAGLQTACLPDGSIRVSASRQIIRRQP
jgi:hypothetical protein